MSVKGFEHIHSKKNASDGSSGSLTIEEVDIKPPQMSRAQDQTDTAIKTPRSLSTTSNKNLDLFVLNPKLVNQFDTIAEENLSPSRRKS